jgi:hypothetical protein
MMMRRFWAKGVLTVGVGFAVVLGQGCKRRAVTAPAGTGGVRRPAPQVAPSHSGDLFPVDDSTEDTEQPQARRHRAVMPQAMPTAGDLELQRRQAAAQAEELQRQQDARLWQQQEAASQKAQHELDQEVERNMKAQQQVDAEPRIQDAPGPEQMGLPPGLTAPEPEGIQDAPGPAQTLPVQPNQPPASSIQDAPGPAQTLPQQPQF